MRCRVPTTISTNVGKDERGQQGTSFCDTPVQVRVLPQSPSAVYRPHPRQSTTSIRMQENPSGGTSSRKGISTPDVTSSRRDKKKPSRLTAIDLRIKQV
jgi:hypothetical protein